MTEPDTTFGSRLRSAMDGRGRLCVGIDPHPALLDAWGMTDSAVGLELDGIIATNTTISRDGLSSTPEQVAAAGAGGVSGRPLRARACEVLRLLRGRVGDGMVLIGVGGISSPADAVERLDAGADLLQAYTAFIYEGPLWPTRMNARLACVDRAEESNR